VLVWLPARLDVGHPPGHLRVRAEVRAPAATEGARGAGGDRRRGAELTFTVGQKRSYNLGALRFLGTSVSGVI
jgi:hypothetical protein